MQSFTLFNTKSYHISTDYKNNEILIHKNQSSIYDFIEPKQLTIYDFISDK